MFEDSPIAAVSWVGERGAEGLSSRVSGRVIIWRQMIQKVQTEMRASMRKENICKRWGKKKTGMFQSRSSPRESVAMEMPLPCSPSFESVSDSKTRQEATEKKVCGGGPGEKEEKVECKAKSGGSWRYDTSGHQGAP